MHSDNSPASSEYSEDDALPRNYHWQRFKWMFWKDCCIHWNTRWEYLFALLLPCIFSIIAVIVRCSISPEHLTARNYEVLDLDRNWQILKETITERQESLELYFGKPTYNVYAPRLIIAYSPNIMAVANIMNLAMRKISLNIEETAEFHSCAELREKMKTEYYFAGVCFSEQNFQNKSESIYNIYDIYPNRLEYSIIFPSELRVFDDYIGETWDTKHLFPNLGQEERIIETYINEGFVMLQKTISESYIYFTTKKSLGEEIQLRKFPKAERYNDPLPEMLQSRMSLLLSVAYIGTILYFLRILVSEREISLNNVLAILDVTYFLQFYSWFTFALISMSCGSIILLLFLKIPWNMGFCVLSRCSFIPLFILLTAFNINALSFCYMISRVIRNHDMAICAAPILWVMFYVPYAIGIDSFPGGDILHPYLALLGNTALALALQHCFELEYHDGLGWSNFFKNELPNVGYNVGTYALLLCCSSILQALIGIFAPIIARVPGKLMKRIRKPKPRVRESESNRYSKTIIFEVRSNYKPPVVEVQSLTVVIGDKVVLDDVTFSLYEDEITMLMGHNGSGKTKLIEVIAGLRRPTSGKVTIRENTEGRQAGSGIDFIGVCFADEMLFRNLYVVHQLILFGKLKGLHSNDLNKEVNKYLEALELDRDRYTLIEKLTCGQRTKLAVSCALIGGSRIVLMDDIVLKLDVRDYKLIWKLLEKEKFGRVILISTHSSHELEMHADNIVMLAMGRLRCAGTTQFLKSMYCFGCHLLISKSESCKSEEVTKLLSKFIPDIAAACDLVLELSYHIESSNVEVLESVFKALESRKEQLGIINITIIETRIEELFCKLGAERPAYDDRKRYLRIFNGLSITEGDPDDVLFMNTKILRQPSIYQRWYNNWCAMFYKFILIQNSYKKYFPMFLILPTICIIITVFAITPHVDELPARDCDIHHYKDAITLLAVGSKSKKVLAFAETYNGFLYWRNSNIKIRHIKNELTSEYILRQQRQHTYNYLSHKILLGVAIDDRVVGWFNGYLPAIPSLVLNLLHNSYLWYYRNNTNAKINVTLEFLPIESEVDIREISDRRINMGSIMALQMSFILCYLMSLRIMYLVSERSSGFESLQRLAGLSSINYWTSMFVFDMLKIIVFMTIFIAIIWIGFSTLYVPTVVLRWCVGLLILASTAITSTNYLLGALFFKSSHGAYFKITTFQAMGAIFYVLFSRNFKNYVHKIAILPRIFPLYSFCRGVENIYDYNMQKELCVSESIYVASVLWETCEKLPNCCEDLELTIYDDVSCLWIIIMLSWLGILIFECRNLFACAIPIDNYDRALDEYKRRHASNSYEVDSVTAENIIVQSMRPRNRYYYNVICENLGLIRKNRILVDRLSFTIRPGEKFGIIGTNCNYTNALLRLIAGQEKPSFGRVHINNASITEERGKALAHIAYVPTVSCVQLRLTCAQILKMFCVLYGYPRNEIKEICEDFAKQFGLYSHYHMLLDDCSSGIKERVSLAIALLKKPSLICIGNFSLSIDPHGRRQLYRLLDGLRKQGTAVMVTSVANSYSEILCTKIAIMRDGQFVHIGSPEKIGATLAKGYSVVMRMKKTVQTPHGVTSKVYFRLTAFMEKTFPTSKLVQEGTIMKYYIPHHSTTLSVIFKTLRLNSFQLNVESITITTINMNYIFEQIAENARKPRVG
ncbi:ATP-binding cassette sub-family A member 12 isoform X1 [Ceratitis capitata]|uniref:ATP-binding cassette sub-family A member 12 isoform X1 n=1 Tax=Ceratitis capitata TaxID=7213 RepID=UPI000C6C5226|nr:ATP-binding cassette sub-family A member 12 isoform X1 [Ceratitis capitata]